MTLVEAVSSFLVAIQAEGARAETVKWYHGRLALFGREYGARELTSVGIDDVRAFIVKVQGLGYARATEFATVRAVRRLLKWLGEEGKIDGRLYKRIKLPRLPQPLPKGMEKGDIETLLRACGASPMGKRDRAIILFFLDTGCRIGGLCGLRVQDVDLEHRRAQISEKGEKARTVLFGKHTAKALRAWLAARPFPESEAIFTSMRDGRPACPNTVSQMLKRLKRRTGIKGRANPHAFRHTFAREYILNGGDLASLSEMMGHSQILVTKQFYAVFNAEELRGKHEQFSPVGRLSLSRARPKREGAKHGKASTEG